MLNCVKELKFSLSCLLIDFLIALLPLEECSPSLGGSAYEGNTSGN